jgi:hypothetical protein
MPRKRQNRTNGARREPPNIPPLAVWFLREIMPLLQRRRKRASRSKRHLKNAGIEVLEAMRVCLDDVIEWLREEDRSAPMKRIEVED